MIMIIREYTKNDLPAIISLWNEVVAEGNAFPQEEKLGFKQLGVIPDGFRMKDGSFENICPYYIQLNKEVKK